MRRIISEEIDSAQKHLTKPLDENRDRSVHEARKSIKKLRGLLRLIRPTLGKTYKKEDQQLRDIGRKLSELRDVRAIIEIFEAVVKETEPQNVLDGRLVQAVRDRLQAHKSEKEQNLNVIETLDSAVLALASLRERVDTYQLNQRGFESLERGLKDTFRRGRKAMALAQELSTPEAFHDWRKRVKDHWYHVRLLGNLNTTFVKTREDDLKKLETWLGDDHNLVVLRETINRDRAGFGHPKQVQHFLAITKQHGKELRLKAVALGKRLYEMKPKQFLKEFATARDIWPQEPIGLKDYSVLADSILEKSRTAADDSYDTKKLRKKAGVVRSEQARVKERVVSAVS